MVQFKNQSRQIGAEDLEVALEDGGLAWALMDGTQHPLRQESTSSQRRPSMRGVAA